MRDMLEANYHCTLIQFGEGTDEDMEAWSALQHGRLIRADSLALLISALSERGLARVLEAA